MSSICVLLFKLKPILLLLRSFLINRTFQVDVPGSKFTSMPILTGVPQGSVLGDVFYTQ